MSVPKLENLDCKYGAPMGRRAYWPQEEGRDAPKTLKVYLHNVIAATPVRLRPCAAVVAERQHGHHPRSTGCRLVSLRRCCFGKALRISWAVVRA